MVDVCFHVPFCHDLPESDSSDCHFGFRVMWMFIPGTSGVLGAIWVLRMSTRLCWAPSFIRRTCWTVEPLNPRAADLWKWFVRDLPYVCADYASTIGLLIVGFGILVAFWSFDRGIATPLLNQGLGIRSWHWKILKICGLISGLVNLTIFAE